MTTWLELMKPIKSLSWQDVCKYAVDNGAAKIFEYGKDGFEFGHMNFFENGTVEVIAPGPYDNYSVFLGHPNEMPMSYEDMLTLFDILVRQKQKYEKWKAEHGVY